MRVLARTWTTGLLCWAMGMGLWVSGVARAQTPAAYANPTPDRIAIWLKSTSAQDRAWGAHSVVLTRDASFLPMLESLAEQWEPALPYRSLGGDFTNLEQKNQDHHDAMTAVLDAVIVMGGQISPQALLKLQADFPAQSAVLLSRLAPMDAEPTLLAMVHDLDPQHWKQRRVAAELLGLNPPAGFAASIMKESEINIRVAVVVPGQPVGRVGQSASCGGGPQRPPDDPNWPVVGQYLLWDHFTNSNDSTIYPVVSGYPFVVARRTEAARSWTQSECGTLAPFTTTIRLQLIARMLLLADAKTLDIYPESESTIIAASTQEYERKLSEIVSQEEAKLLPIETQLQSKGFVTADEITRGEAKPSLHLYLWDARADKDKTFELPKIDFHDPSIVWNP